MAATRLIALHKNKGKSVAACLKSRTDYVQNPDKTQQGELVSSYECSPLTVDEEFMLSKRQYELVTGRRQKSDVIAYQIRQSFKPGEITAEEANKVGYELAMRFTKGKYLPDVGTLVDQTAYMDGQLSAVHIVCLVTEQIEKLGVNHADEKVKGGIRVRHDEEQRRFLIAQRI